MKIKSRGQGKGAESKGRLIPVVFSLAGGLLILSMIVVFQTGHFTLEAQQKMGAQLEAMNQLREWESSVKDAETGQRGFLLTGEESYLQPYSQALERLNAEAHAMQRFAAAGEVSRDEVEKTIELIREKLSELDKTIRLRREVSPDAALEEVRTDRGKNIMDQIRQNCDNMLNDAKASYAAAVRRADTIDVWRSAIYLVVTLINLAFLTWAFQRISRQEWLQTGRGQLNDRLSGDQQLGEMANKILTFLAEYLDAKVGALFIQEKGVFCRMANYALASPEKYPQKFALGEGLLGQAARDKRVFLVNQVPPGYVMVGSALGQGEPRQLLLAPMLADGTVNAVVELGFLRRLDEAAVEFLDQISEATGVAIQTAHYRSRLQELLEETQRQAEELQTQSEELRVSNEELTEQSRALKESQGRLEQQQVELEQSNSQLEEQTQVLEAQKEDLGRAKVELENQAAIVEQASRYKSDFLANMSHELRTPLNSSLILAKLLSDNREGNLTAEQIKYAQTIQAAGNDLLTLINDVLDLAKVEAGRMDLKAESLDLDDMLESLRGMFEPLAAAKGLKLQLTRAAEAPRAIEADRRRLEQVLKNLLSNAIKFTDQGRVTVDVSRRDGGRVGFAVRDTGIGIAGDQQKIIFEPFRQVESNPERKYGGTGLGLSISRELVRLMGGSLEVQSEAGKGSVFTVSLPESNKILKTSAPRPFREPEPRRERSTSAGPPAASELTKPRVPDDRDALTGTGRVILVVEDDDSFAKILIDLSHELRFQALLAQSAEQALALALRFMPSGVILDIGLPDNSGMFVLERLKADPRTRHIPVHVVSGSDYSEPAMAMGAVGYILKPVKRDELVEAFQKMETRLTQKLRRVLLVEDDPVQLDSLKHLLGSRDVETVGVRTASDCLEKLQDATFDCMVLDLSLPDASGFSLLEKLSAEDRYSFPPVIIYTGRELNPDEEQLLRKHSKSIIIKGARSPERLLDEVTLFLHQVVSNLPADKRQMLEKARSRDAGLDGKTILVAEDDIRNIFALTSLLEPKGIKVRVARNGREAVQAVEKSEKTPAQRIDLVLMDIMMPEMNGLDAMRAIRKNSNFQRLPIIALTAKAMKDDQEHCIRAGASDYLAKPIDVEKLLSLIRVWMPR